MSSIEHLPNNFPIVNGAGFAAAFSTAGSIDFTDDFNTPQGTNGRDCQTCHQSRPQVATSRSLTPCFPRSAPANSRLLPHGPPGLPHTAPCTRMTCRCVAQERCSSRTRPRPYSWGPVRRHLEVRRERRSIGIFGTSRISCHTPASEIQIRPPNGSGEPPPHLTDRLARRLHLNVMRLKSLIDSSS